MTKLLLLLSLLCAGSLIGMDVDVTLQSGDKQRFVIAYKLAKQSKTITDLIEDAGTNDPISLPNVSGATLSGVVDYLRADPQPKKIDRQKLSELVDLTLAANYLDIPSLLNLSLDACAESAFRADLEQLEEKESYDRYKTEFHGRLHNSLHAAIIRRGEPDWLCVHQLTTFRHPGVGRLVVVSADGSKIITRSEGLRAVNLWSADRRKPLAIFKHDGMIKAVAISADGRKIITGAEDNTACLWSADASADPKPLATFKHAGYVNAVAISADGKRVVTGSSDNMACLWSADANDDPKPLLATFRHADCVNAVAISADGRKVVTGSDDGTACLWSEPDAPRALATFKHDGYIKAVTISADGKKVVTRSGSKTACLWSVEANSNPKPLTIWEYDNSDNPVAIEVEGKGLVAAAELKMVQAEVEVPKLLATFRSEHLIFALSRDGRKIVTVPEQVAERTACLWSVDAGDDPKPLIILKHGDFVNAIGINADGSRIVTGGADRKTRLWELPSAADLDLKTAQIMAYVKVKNIKALSKLPDHLKDDMNDYAKRFLFPEKKKVALGMKLKHLVTRK